VPRLHDGLLYGGLPSGQWQLPVHAVGCAALRPQQHSPQQHSPAAPESPACVGTEALAAAAAVLAQDPSGTWSLAGGAVASELASPSCMLARSSTALGARLQGRVRTQLARLLPVAASVSLAHLVSWAPTGELEQGLGGSAEVNCTLRTSTSSAGGGVACSASSSVVRVQRGWSSQVQGSAHWKAAGAKWGLTTQVASRRGRLRLRAHAQSTPLLVIIGICPLLVSAVRRLLRLLPRK
jgi:hypothetical protein